MRDPRTLGPSPAQPSFIELAMGGDGTFRPQAAPAVAQAAAPQPSVASRIVGALGAATDYIPPLNLLKALGTAVQAQPDVWRQRISGGELGLEQQRLENAAAARRAQLEEAALPAQQAQAAAQVRNLGELDSRISRESDPRVREGLIRGAATGTFRPFELEPGPAELAAYESVLGIQQEQVRQQLIGRREAEQARMEAELQRRTTAERLAGELELERGKRALGPSPASFGDASKLRDDFRADSKQFVTIRDSWARLKKVADNPSPAGDLALLFNYMKILDPGSAVRESEFSNAETAASIPDRIRGQWEKVRTGERLAPEVRADFVAQAKAQVDAQSALQERLKGFYSGVAQRSNIRPEDVIVDYDSAEEAPAAPRRTVNGATYEKVDGGWRLVK